MRELKTSYEMWIPGDGHARESVGFCSLWSYMFVMTVQYGALVVHGQFQISSVAQEDSFDCSSTCFVQGLRHPGVFRFCGSQV